MSDQDLRELEREILAAPASLELRRRHAQVLFRLGQEDRALGALDLAWRLGATDLWDELRDRLAKRRLEIRGTELAYVPGGPFVMGSDDLDEDARPAHIVSLSAFYVAVRPLVWGALDGWRGNRAGLRAREPYRTQYLKMPVWGLTHDLARDAIAYIEGAAATEGHRGRWSLISEAQWERVFRAAHLRPDGTSPYGVVVESEVYSHMRCPEWTADGYDADAYSEGSRVDPVEPVTSRGQLRVVRGVPPLPPPHFATYREAANADGGFEIPSSGGGLFAGAESGIRIRAVFVP